MMVKVYYDDNDFLLLLRPRGSAQWFHHYKVSFQQPFLMTTILGQNLDVPGIPIDACWSIIAFFFFQNHGY